MELDDCTNQARVLDTNSTHVVLSLPVLTSQNVSVSGKAGDDYDADGAVMFIIVTVCIYSLGVVAFVAGHIFEKNRTSTSESQIAEYVSTFNMTYLDNVSKMYMLRSMQRKLLTRYDMFLNEELLRNATIRQNSFRKHCDPKHRRERYPRIFQNVVCERSILHEESIAGSCSTINEESSFLKDESKERSLGVLTQPSTNQDVDNPAINEESSFLKDESTEKTLGVLTQPSNNKDLDNSTRDSESVRDSSIDQSDNNSVHYSASSDTSVELSLDDFQQEHVKEVSVE